MGWVSWCTDLVSMLWRWQPRHLDELCGILERVDSDEQGVTACCDVSNGVGLYCCGPFKVPPESCFRAMPTCGCKARAAMRNAKGDARDEVCDWARFWGAGRGQGPLDEV